MLLKRCRRPDENSLSSTSEPKTGGDRGRWLYRGYLVGSGSAPRSNSPVSSGVEDLEEGKGYIVGRWRDMLTPTETNGYEGAFAMARRR